MESFKFLRIPIGRATITQWVMTMTLRSNGVHDGSSFLVPGIFCFNNMGCRACSHAHDLNLEEGNVIGNFNGEFWGMGGTTSGSGTTLLYIVFVCSMTLGTILMCFLQKRDAKGEETLPDSSHLAECTKYIAEPALGESGVGGAMAVYGAFDAIVRRSICTAQGLAMCFDRSCVF
ncbi:unnamed protein product [Camellia sinensis]